MKLYKEKLKQTRKEKGYTLKSLAQKLGMHITTVHSYESGKLVPKEKTIEKIADILGVSASVFSDIKPEKSTEYSALWLKYKHRERRVLEKEQNEWHSTIESFYKEINHLNRTIKGLLHAMPSIFYIKDKNLKYVIANDAFYDTLDNFKNIVGKTDFEILSKRKAYVNHSRDMEVLKKEKTIKVKDSIPLTRKNKIGIITKTPLYDEEHELIGILCSITDITNMEKQKQENITLKTAKNALFAMHDNSPDSVWIMVNNQVVYKNPKAIKLYGQEIFDLETFPFLSTEVKISDFEVKINSVNYDLPYAILDFQNSDQSTLNFIHEHKIIKDNEIFSCRSFYQLIKETDYIQISCVTRDITSETRIQQEKDQIFQVLELIKFVIDKIDNYTIFISTSGKNPKYIYLSDGFESLTGYSKSYFQNDAQIWLKHIHPEDQARIKKIILADNFSETGIDFRYRFITKQGNIVQLHNHNFKAKFNDQYVYFGFVKELNDKTTIR